MGGQAELLLEACGKAAGGVVATGEGGLKRREPLLQQGEGVPQAYLGQHLAKAAPLGGQFADQGGAAHGEVGRYRLQPVIKTRLHAEVTGQPFPQGHGGGRKEQAKAPRVPELAIKPLQQLGLGRLAELPLRHGGDEIEAEGEGRRHPDGRWLEEIEGALCQPLGRWRGQQGERLGAKRALLRLVDEGEPVTRRDQQPALLVKGEALLPPPQLLAALLHPDEGRRVDEHPAQGLLADPEVVIQLQQGRAHRAGS